MYKSDSNSFLVIVLTAKNAFLKNAYAFNFLIFFKDSLRGKTHVNRFIFFC